MKVIKLLFSILIVLSTLALCSQEAGYTAKVQRVIDGHTIQLNNGETVRYIGIDTPETKHPEKGVEYYGQEAYEANKNLVEAKTVRLEFDVQERDKYGRLLAYVYLEDGTFVNAWLVENGYAQIATYSPNVKYQELFLELQRKARDGNKGLWGKAPEMDYYNIITLVILGFVGLAGWASFVWERISIIPNIKGQIINVIISKPKPRDPRDQGRILTFFHVYLYFTNTRRGKVHILDYELEVDTGDGYEKMIRGYGIQELKPAMDFEDQQGVKYEIPAYPQKVLYAMTNPVEYGIPLHGFATFASERPKSQFIKNVKRYKVTCVDAFKKRHEIISLPDEFPSFLLWQELAGIKRITSDK